jgi:hypothetical protein
MRQRRRHAELNVRLNKLLLRYMCMLLLLLHMLASMLLRRPRCSCV